MSSRATRSGRKFSSPSASPKATPRKSSRVTGSRSAVTPGPATTPGSRRSHRSVSTIGSKGEAGDYDHYSSSTEDEDNSVSSLVQGSIATGSTQKNKCHARTNARGIDLVYQKILFEDIEAFGGLDRAVAYLTPFCDQAASLDNTRSRFYGEARSKDRFRIENKVRKWAKLSPEDLEKVRHDLQVVTKPNIVGSSGILPSIVAVPDVAPSSSEARKVKSSSASRKSGGSTSKSAGPSKTKAKTELPRSTAWDYREPKKALDSSDEEPSVPAIYHQQQTTMSGGGGKIEYIGGVLTETVVLNPHRIESTSEPFKCYRISNLTGAEEGTKFSGYLITMKVEGRDAVGALKQEVDNKVIAAVDPFPYKCFVTGPNSLRVVAPLASASDRGLDDEKMRAGVAVAGVKLEGLDENESVDLGISMINALDDARNKYIARNGGLPSKESRGYHAAFKHFNLQFSSDVRVELEEGDKLLVNKIKPPKAGTGKKKKKPKQLEPGQLYTRSFRFPYEVHDHTKAGVDWPTKQFPNKDGELRPFKLWITETTPKLYWIVADLASAGDQFGRLDEDDESEDDDDDYVKRMRGFGIRPDPPQTSSHPQATTRGDATMKDPATTGAQVHSRTPGAQVRSRTPGAQVRSRTPGEFHSRTPRPAPLEPSGAGSGQHKNDHNDDDDLSLGDMSPRNKGSNDTDALDAAVEDLKGHMAEGAALLDGTKDERMAPASLKRTHVEASSKSFSEAGTKQYIPFVQAARKRIFEQFPKDARDYFSSISNEQEQLRKYYIYLENLKTFLPEWQQVKVQSLEDSGDEEESFAALRKGLEMQSELRDGTEAYVVRALQESLANTMNNILLANTMNNMH